MGDDLLHWFLTLLVDMGDALKALGTMIYKMIFENSPIGKVLKKIIEIVCKIVMFLINTVWKDFLCHIMQMILPPMCDVICGFLQFIDGIVGVIESIAKFFGSGLPDPDIIKRAIQKVQDFKSFVEDGGLQCDKKMDDICNPFTNESAITGALPTATRCWVGYETSVAESSPLGCTRADTCFDSRFYDDPTTTAHENMVVCDGCPLLEAQDFMHFGCSPLTKKCTCGVQQYEPTRCTSHEQCFLETSGASCQRKSDIFSTSFSTTPCAECMTQQICVVTSMDSPGYCVCPFSDIEVEPCKDIGQLVTPDPNAKCSVMLNSQILSTANSYIAWKDLTITECAILDPARTYCYRVDASGGTQVNDLFHNMFIKNQGFVHVHGNTQDHLLSNSSSLM